MTQANTQGYTVDAVAARTRAIRKYRELLRRAIDRTDGRSKYSGAERYVAQTFAIISAQIGHDMSEKNRRRLAGSVMSMTRESVRRACRDADFDAGLALDLYDLYASAVEDLGADVAYREL